MLVALYIAAQSFFGGQEDVFPAAMQGTFWMKLPEQLIVAALVVWLGIVLFLKRYGARTAAPAAA